MRVAISLCCALLLPQTAVSLALQGRAPLSTSHRTLPCRACAERGAEALAPPPPPPLSPQNAMEELGPLLEQVKAVWTEGSTWSAEERVRCAPPLRVRTHAR